ncbi:YfiT family bacillithiol transferase [Pedobacter psychroterrae]|uniref:Putative metal-dependent hydrolase n=1 Tax=Pedobacter psychroterrae TaxID=2530453 RepID=A0A4R0NI15_9SPHI|nr:bacillithiol transferase BstA [Pedobacter psychroterrae]TCC98992.1 putative metal-dependent hydrolase [Pedobacter psychroterrae]
MDTEQLEKLRFPIGKYIPPSTLSREMIDTFIMEIETLPNALKEEVFALNEEQLDTQYRPEGWTVRQVVHHLADSHINSYIRCKLALTEDNPTIKPYFEERWAELQDGKNTPVDSSLQLLEGLHIRWVALLKSLSDQDLTKAFVHPEHGKTIKLSEVVALYAHHGRHHLAQITELKKRKGW